MGNTISTQNNAGQRLSLTRPARYQIKVQGWLGLNWSDWFDGVTIKTEKDQANLPVTILTGTVADQAGLHGLLDKLYNLGLPLLALTCLDPNPCLQQNSKRRSGCNN